MPSTTPAFTSSGRALPAATALGAVALTVSDVDRARFFYESVIGLNSWRLEGGDVALGVVGDAPLVTLHGDPTAPPRDPHATGLFHLAIVLPDRRALAHALLRLAQARHPLSGASDHLVSEALYLADPDGNGIELYRDRPRDQWRREPDGTLTMATLRLDLAELAAELDGAGEPAPHAPAGTRVGHVHLQVADIATAETFYHGILGFDVTVRTYPGALFVSAGGYHHHVGLNTWNSQGAAAPDPAAVGLRSYEIILPDREALDAVLARIAAAGLVAEPVADHGTLVRDPSGNAVLLRSR